ncbi:THUMP domain-containing protein 1 homolog [Armigeres subalbatus]|uniref:THUMP domain-containing protein 1 homolog n=1 Tax=Armigeres subalbatus TaxID=124917 RepID=UPI002ED0D6DC
MSTAAKRPKMDKKGKTDKRNYYAKAFSGGDSRRKYLEPGQCGFMVTCNFREKDCIQESYRLLNECADELYGKAEEDSQKKKPAADQDDAEEEDISVLVQNQAEAVKKERPQFRFQSVETGAKNCCFITTTLKEPKELALKILRDLHETKKRKSRNILRLMPIEVVTRANLKDIIDASGSLFDKYFLKEPKTFAIMFNKRFNNSIERTEVIEELAGLVASKNIHNKANLKNPDLAIIVEVVKGLCLISVVPDYFLLRKYNLVEICAGREEASKEKVSEDKKGDDQETNSSKAEEEPETSEKETDGTQEGEKELSEAGQESDEKPEKMKPDKIPDIVAESAV